MIIITMQDIIDSGGCARGAVKFFKLHDWSNDRISMFINRGMVYFEFKSEFKDDALASTVIKYMDLKYGLI